MLQILLMAATSRLGWRTCCKGPFRQSKQGVYIFFSSGYNSASLLMRGSGFVRIVL